MVEFDESKVINALHPEKAEVGKKYWCSDNLYQLKQYVKSGDTLVYKLDGVDETSFRPFCTADLEWQFLYPYEEPPKKRMTHRQFAEWLMKGNGEYIDDAESAYAYVNYAYSLKDANKEVASDVKIRSWDSDGWIEPTEDIYERDCRGDK